MLPSGNKQQTNHINTGEIRNADPEFLDTAVKFFLFGIKQFNTHTNANHKIKTSLQ